MYKSLLVALFFSSLAFADVDPNINRVLDNRNDAVRCHPTPEGCGPRQKKALDRGCINHKEYATLLANNDYAVCDWEAPRKEDMFEAWCPCGCFDKDVNIFAVNRETSAEGYVPAEQLYKNFRSFDLVGLDDAATLDSLSFATFKIKKVTHGPEEVPMYVFKTKSGRKIKLTSGHGVLIVDANADNVASDAMMIKASDVKVGQAFVLRKANEAGLFSAAADTVVSVTNEAAEGEVFNFLTSGKENINHTLVANDFVVGDLAWQNSLESEIGKIAVRQ